MVLLVFAALMASTFCCFLFVTHAGAVPASFGKRFRAIEYDGRPGNKSGGTVQLGANTEKKRSTRLHTFAAQLTATKALHKLLMQSGCGASPSRVLGWSTVAAIAAGSLAFFILHLASAAAASFVAAAFTPLLALRWMCAKRVATFEAALPEAIDLLARSLRAGHSVSSALEILGEQATGPLSEEFKQVAQQQRLGAMFRDTLVELAGRVPSQDLHFLITAILVQRENGGDLTQILDRTAKVISERMRIAGEVRIYSAQGRLTGWLLSALPVVLLVIINIGNPGYSKVLFSDPTGRIMLGGALVSIVAGALMIRKIVDIKV